MREQGSLCALASLGAAKNAAAIMITRTMRLGTRLSACRRERPCNEGTTIKLPHSFRRDPKFRPYKPVPGLLEQRRLGGYIRSGHALNESEHLKKTSCTNFPIGSVAQTDEAVVFS